MRKVINTPHLAFKTQALRYIFVEVLDSDNRLAHAVAQPLFDAGICQASIAERRDAYRSTASGGRTYHTVSLLLQGEMQMVMNGQRFDLKPGDLAVCPAGQPMNRAAGKAGIWWLYFDIMDLPAWAPLKKQQGYVRPYESAAHMFLLLRDTLDVMKNRRPVAIARAQDNCRALVNLLRHEMIRTGMEHSPKTVPLHRLVEAITEAPEKQWDQQALAKTLHLSVSQMARLFQNELGVSPKELVIRQRMLKATQLLDNTEWTIETIAAELGYASLYSFTRLFTRHVGMPPGQYRNRAGPASDASG